MAKYKVVMRIQGYKLSIQHAMKTKQKNGMQNENHYNSNFGMNVFWAQFMTFSACKDCPVVEQSLTIKFKTLFKRNFESLDINKKKVTFDLIARRIKTFFANLADSEWPEDFANNLGYKDAYVYGHSPRSDSEWPDFFRKSPLCKAFNTLLLLFVDKALCL